MLNATHTPMTNASPGASLGDTPANQAKLALLRRMLGEQLQTALKRGFHGTTTIELSVQDGTIQHVRHRIEQVER